MEHQNFTREMDAVITGLKDDLKSFYCREDFRAKIREVNDQYKRKRSGYASRLNELKKMCQACGINPKDLQDPETIDATLSGIPTKKELHKLLLTRLHDLYRQFPTSADYMERLVRRRLSGQFAEDSLRLAILKKLYLETDYETAALEKLVCKRKKWKLRKDMDPQARRERVLSALDEYIFWELDNEWNPRVRLELMLRRIRTIEPVGFIFSPGLYAEIAAQVGAVVTAPDHTGTVCLLEALQRCYTVDEMDTFGKLMDKIDGEYSRYLKDAEDTGFGTKKPYLRRWNDAKKTAAQTKQVLLKMANDLAQGIFTGGGVTRKQLYIFAIAFGMTTEFGGNVFDPDTDIEKNLFHDYYQDNLLRYLMAGQNDNAIPSGEGINYKNFAEVIYLYVMAKYPQQTAREKLDIAENLISGCQKAIQAGLPALTEAPRELTAHFRDVLGRELMQLPGDEVIPFICGHYYVYDARAHRKEITYANRQNTARKKYLEIANRLKESCGGEAEDLISGAPQISNLIRQLTALYADDDAFVVICRDYDFVRLLHKMDYLLSQGRTTALTLWQKGNELDKYHRTGLISLYYCYLLNILETDRLVKNYAIVSLPDLYSFFCNGDDVYVGINTYLEESRFQKISTKNAFDMFTIFLLFLEVSRQKETLPPLVLD